MSNEFKPVESPDRVSIQAKVLERKEKVTRVQLLLTVDLPSKVVRVTDSGNVEIPNWIIKKALS